MKAIVSLTALLIVTSPSQASWVTEWQCAETVVRVTLGDKTDPHFRFEFETPPLHNFDFKWVPDGTKTCVPGNERCRAHGTGYMNGEPCVETSQW